jgi:hypothetical protein
MKVFVYFNLHRKLWSVKALEGPNKGLVIGHASYLDLVNVTWKVSEAGRQRVLNEKKKNVHAGAVGTLESALWERTLHYVSLSGERTRYTSRLLHDSGAPVRVSYNPFKGSTFVNVDDGSALLKSDCAYFTPNRRVYAYV